jgi:DNA-binding NarL/FixJ family response regulator
MMNILLADDHALFRQGLWMIIEEIFPTCSLYQCESWEDIPQNISFDLMLLDIFMPRKHTWEEKLAQLAQHNSNTSICIISASSEIEHIQTAFQLGAKGYICKTTEPSEMMNALLEISQGNIYFPPQLQPSFNTLTLRQQEILKLMANGKCNKLIARQLHLSESTVKRHIYNICQILNTHNRVEAIEAARQQGLLSDTSKEIYGAH